LALHISFDNLWIKVITSWAVFNHKDNVDFRSMAISHPLAAISHFSSPCTLSNLCAARPSIVGVTHQIRSRYYHVAQSQVRVSTYMDPPGSFYAEVALAPAAQVSRECSKEYLRAELSWGKREVRACSMITHLLLVMLPFNIVLL
jgi:hypothetical protein